MLKKRNVFKNIVFLSWPGAVRLSAGEWRWAKPVTEQLSEVDSVTHRWRQAGVMLVCRAPLLTWVLLTWVLLAAGVQSQSWRPCTGTRM